ncbi:IclR family transcriptional regulator [Calidifontibacillus oryziterrae]|uniref:IclR family transcriptional regulator n=1 Tax=Calidifontibacillus oryziterrae TaxID=1191699 RepID=UPI000315670A|nr:IclR family transcriptional regulator [Calidifontibacillus oryziterrae]
MKSFEKLFNILSLFSMDRTSLSISEIQAELGYPKSTVFRMLDTLERFDYIERNPDNHRYSLGFNFFRLGSIVQNQLDFRKVALPIMKTLVEQTSETVELNIIDGLSRVCVEKVDSPLDVRNFVRIGEQKPLHLGASGKVLLAYLNEDQVKRMLCLLQSENNSLQVSELAEKLKTIKVNGYCVTRGERVPGSFAVAAPIFGQNGELLASITIAGPIQRLTVKREKELIEKLIESAKSISSHLGCFTYN